MRGLDRPPLVFSTPTDTFRLLFLNGISGDCCLPALAENGEGLLEVILLSEGLTGLI